MHFNAKLLFWIGVSCWVMTDAQGAGAPAQCGARLQGLPSLSARRLHAHLSGCLDQVGWGRFRRLQREIEKKYTRSLHHEKNQTTERFLDPATGRTVYTRVTRKLPALPTVSTDAESNQEIRLFEGEVRTDQVPKLIFLSFFDGEYRQESLRTLEEMESIFLRTSWRKDQDSYDEFVSLGSDDQKTVFSFRVRSDFERRWESPVEGYEYRQGPQWGKPVLETDAWGPHAREFSKFYVLAPVRQHIGSRVYEEGADQPSFSDSVGNPISAPELARILEEDFWLSWHQTVWIPLRRSVERGLQGLTEPI